MEPTLTSTSSPLNPLFAAQSPLAPFLATLDPKHILAILFGFMLMIWLVYSLIVLYHWLRYGNRSPWAIPSFVVHVVISGALFLLALTAF